jgi:hypothetical protein
VYTPVPATFVSKTDRSDAITSCKRVGDFTGTARASYWLYKAFVWLEEHPIPLP